MKPRRRKETHDESFWSKHLEGWGDSGLTQRAYCDLHGLVLSTFQLWRRRLVAAGQPAKDGAAPQFEIVPLRYPLVAGKQVVHSGRDASPLVLEMAGGRYRVELHEGASPVALRLLLDTLEARL